MKTLIIGAGIAGSALALGLERAGMDYVVLEQAEAFGEIGAGIQLSSNAVKVLERLGLMERLAQVCCEPDAHKFKDWATGETILRTPLCPDVRDAFGAPYFHAHRPDVIAALTDGLDPERVRFGCEITDVGEDDRGPWVRTADGEEVRGDVLVGADGIHSVVRDRMFAQAPPRRSGYVTWRGVIDAADVADLEVPVSSYIVMGPRLSFVFYYVSGGSRINWLAMGQVMDGAADEKRESWSQKATKAEVLACFEGWYEVPKRFIEVTDQPFVTALHDRDPLETWVSGNITVLGDAAHAMLPYHASGAGQGIEDAWVLLRCLQLGEDVPAAQALARYQALRKDRADRMIQHSRDAEKWYHLDDAHEVERRNERFRRYQSDEVKFTPQQVWLYSYDAEAAALGTDDDWRALPAW